MKRSLTLGFGLVLAASTAVILTGPSERSLRSAGGANDSASTNAGGLASGGGGDLVLARPTAAAEGAVAAAGEPVGEDAIAVSGAGRREVQVGGWEPPAGVAPFEAFADWVRRWRAAEPGRQAEMAAEGVDLAAARLVVLADLIRADPERALRQAVPRDVRGLLPEAVRGWLEAEVEARGDYEVYCVKPVDGGEPLALVRVARIAGEEYRVYPHGADLEAVTRAGVDLTGIAVPVGAALGFEAEPGSAPAHLMAMSSWSGSGSGVVGAEGLTGLPVAASSYTEGRKRFMLFRVDFPDYAGEVMTTNQALTLMENFGGFMAEMSYGKLVVAPVGEGSDITPTMRLPGNAETYQNMGTFLNACWAEATALGYDKAEYDFWFVCTAGQPSASFAGLGYVGGVGFWLANRYWDVRTCAHEYGHNLGLSHANWWNNGGHSMLGPGSSDEYGDPFDTMGGSGGGIRHFSAYNKNKIDWIPDSDCAQMTTSGRHRLYAQDVPETTGLRGLWFDRPSGGDYWVEFRQLWTAYKALMNGISIRWAGGSTSLLDANPGSAPGKDDHPVAIGRTFSDTNVNLHITPIGKGHTHPESIDVIINVGSFAANRAPSVVATTSAKAGSVGQVITFTASAADPDGDDLAYYWDFGDGDYSVDNQAVTAHSYAGAGEYLAQCIVSDMKGRIASDAVLVRIGEPSTYAIRGRVLFTNGVALPGIKVSVNSSRYAFTEQDGSYTITRLDAGTYTVTAAEPVYGALTFSTSFWGNPVSVPPAGFGMDFVAHLDQGKLLTALVEKESTWNYLDTGVDQGTAWRHPGFDDLGWASGRGVLGYPSGSVRTLLGYGGDSDNKHLTYYFRRTFDVANPSAFTNLQLEVLRDDGVIVYLNGTEVLRDNMPAGTVFYTTPASGTVSGSDETRYFSGGVEAGLLVAEGNVLAAEVHQANSTSSDISFDLALSGLSETNLAGMNLVYIASPENNEVFTVPINLVISATARSASETVERVDFRVNGEQLFSDSAAPYAYWWRQPPAGAYRLEVIAHLGGGLQLTSPPVNLTLAEPVPPPVTIEISPVLPGAYWKYYAGPDGAAAGWAEREFDDTSWPGGPAQLGYGESDEATTVPFGGNASAKWITTYFRHAFTLADPVAVTNLVLSLKRDDGAVVYLNGREVVRDGMPAGSITPQTLASQADDDGKDWHYFTLDRSRLRNGTNLLAVEVHQAEPNSSDLSFDAGLGAWLAASRAPGVWLVSPTADATVSLPGTLALTAEVVTAAGAEVARVDFLTDDGLIAGLVEPPFTYPWQNPPAGEHRVVAVATDTGGLTQTSAPVTVTVTAPPVSRALISFGQRWKYRDTGDDPGTSWMLRNYLDLGWRSGPARLGYGNDGERTTVNAGTNPGERFITTYYRHQFTNDPAVPFSGLVLRLIRDDGAVVYLNGIEIFRDNLQPGPVSYNSLATATVAGGEETRPLQAVLPVGPLLAGMNVLAVEVHQASATSSDTGFDLELSGYTATNISQGIYLVSPAEGARFNAPAAVTLSAYAKAAGANISRIEYYENGTKVGEADAAPFEWVWENAPVGTHAVTAVATYGAGLQMTSAPTAFVVALPAAPIRPVAESLIPTGADWRFWDSATAVAAGWARPEFDDGAWAAGPARLGWGWDGELTPLTEGRVTHYFRRWFTVAEPALLTELTFQLVRDDGAVVYLNGREVFRSNMPSGEVTPGTLALNSVSPPDETRFFETVVATAGAGLVSGSNLVAVELHQGSVSSSDGGFDLGLAASGTTDTRVYVSAPGPAVQLRGAPVVPVEVMALAPAGAAVAVVELFVDGERLGEAPAAPYRFSWPQPAFGTHVLVAQMTDSQGTVIVSAPHEVAVTPELVSASFIRRNAVWNYLDTGVNLLTFWTAPGFNDSGWAAGPARLGYGGDQEVTTVGYGPNASSKYITTYFRRAFVKPSDVLFTNLLFHLQRDDGAVVWLNGVEMFRSNMPGGSINYLTTAAAAAGGGDEQTFFATTMSATALVEGTNVVAVEVHQANGTSSDLGFDLELTGLGYVESVNLPVLRMTFSMERIEVSWPETASHWQLHAALNPMAPAEAWIPVAEAPTAIGGRNVVSFVPNAPRAFFRLQPR